ncbi:MULTISPECIES: transporter substrate-binding domain-containing protein [unclassified Clostridium]|uniref:transporter substrate-binding domain-containing protein n=1 Tax=unclassified Clostridium TaxID=2614128 RepID=UPI0002979B10|nr:MULTISPECIES: transporter substrate-binding domain-containing protein [unclassified Clostridium]EKQ58087.1 MAG: periplasmic component of amino acid ABC-type transporter/signal transduction system [Clostridium sp. Maddingley MBC34-26]
MKKSLIKRVAAALAVGVLALGIAGCGSGKAEGNKDAKSDGISLESIKSKGKLVVGTSADYPPFEFHKEIDGKDTIVGFDIKIAEEIAKDMGVELEIKDMAFDGLLVAEQANKIDLVLAGINPTDERRQNADFSDVYYKSDSGFIVRKGDENTIKSLDDLKGKKIGVQTGSVQETYAQEKLKDSELKSLAKVTDLILDLDSKKVDGVLVNLPVAQLNTEKNEKLGIAPFVLKDIEIGAAVAMKKNSSELQAQVNKTLKRLKDEGKIDEYVLEANKLVD